MNEPLCGRQWHDKHRNDYTQADIDRLGIELKVNDKVMARVQVGQKKARGIVKEIINLNKGGKL